MNRFPTPLPVLATRRLDLRALVDADAQALFDIFADPATMRYWSTPAWTDPAEGLRVIARDRTDVEQASALRFGLFERPGGALVGCCSIHHVDRSNRRAEIGYILRRSHWGRGLMNEAMTAVVDFAFDDLALLRLEADLDPRNAPLARTVERLGFALEGRMRGRWLVDGEVCDSAFYGLLATDWGGPGRRVRPVRNRSAPSGTVVAVLTYDDVPRAVAWLTEAFGFALRIRAGDSHAQLAVGEGSVMLGASRSEVSDGTSIDFGPPSSARVSQSTFVAIDDVDAHHARAMAAGATIIAPPADQPYGERQYAARDLEGHRWTFSQSIADVDPADWGARRSGRDGPVERLPAPRPAPVQADRNCIATRPSAR